MISRFVLVLFASLLLAGGFFYYLNLPKQDEVVDTERSQSSAPIPVSEETTVSEKIRLPLSGSAPEVNVPHTIPIEEIRRGCFRQDCIPSVDAPEFLPGTELVDVLNPDSIGIALSYKGEHRFYPFPMLETHELVNDVVAGDPVLISYCPLCGTGIVFDRTLDGQAVEFGVSGMLWQSNLLMYNRADELENRNLWSQVLGQAVVGERAGEKLTIIPSDIIRFSDWMSTFPNELVLTTGTPRDPYNGEYFRVASSFAPRFDETVAALPPDSYVYGVLLEETPIAIPRDVIAVGQRTYVVDSLELIVNRTEEGNVQIYDQDRVQLPDVEGFWFSWQSAYPDTRVVQ